MYSRMLLLIIFVITFIFSSCTLAVQSYTNWPDIRGPNLGQKPPGMTSEIFAPGIISTEQSEINSVFTPDGKEFYFTTWTRETGTQIMVTSQNDGRWKKPELASFSKGFGDVDIAISYDGDRIFFGTKRPRPGETEMRADGYDIWYANRNETGWDEEQFLGHVINSGIHQVYPSITKDGTMYFQAKRVDSYGKADIYRSRLIDGHYQAPENLGPVINSNNYEGDVYIAEDESYLIVSISGREDSLGGGDLYISFSEGDTWTALKNMGSAVNSDKREFCPMLSPDGKYFFFTSKRTGANDIYWIDAKIIDTLRPEQ